MEALISKIVGFYDTENHQLADKQPFYDQKVMFVRIWLLVLTSESDDGATIAPDGDR